VAYGILYNRNRAAPVPDPSGPSRPVVRLDRSPAARDAARQAKAERERRDVDLVNDGLSMAEIAAREGVSERGMLKSIRALIARRGPEATDAFIAVQVNRLNEAPRTSYGAASEKTLATVDRVVGIACELGRRTALAAQRAEPNRVASHWKASIREPKSRRSALSLASRIGPRRGRRPIRPRIASCLPTSLRSSRKTEPNDPVNI
jgi:DNA-binding CsgD family transcriptional regulator